MVKFVLKYCVQEGVINFKRLKINSIFLSKTGFVRYIASIKLASYTSLNVHACTIAIAP